MTIYFYSNREKFGEFSNFASYGVQLDGKWWKTTEHYFQAQKFLDEGHKEKIRLAPSPKEAANLGRSRDVPIRDDWEEIKDEVMKIAVREKFTTHPSLKELLISTGNEDIVENAPGDYYWGCGKDGTGSNHLGKILVMIREEISAT